MVKDEKNNNERFGVQSGEGGLELDNLLSYFAGLSFKPVVVLGKSGLVGLNESGREIVEEIKRDRKS